MQTNSSQETAQAVSTPLSEEQKTIQPADEFVETMAEQIGVNPGQLVKRSDIPQVLQHMQEGIVVQLHISRPRFRSKLTLDDLGLTSGQESAVREDALGAITDYFELGRRHLLPKVYQDRLTAVENGARYHLARVSFKSHWGAFIPVTLFEQWQAKNKEYEEAFWTLKEEIVQNYEQIVEQVVEELRPVAEDAWRRFTLGAATKDQLSEEIMSGLVGQLQAEQGKAAFLDRYLHYIRRTMPRLSDVEVAFAYRVELSVVPLPSLVAQDQDQANRIYKERALRDAQVQAELARLEAQKQADLQRLTEQQREEQQAQYIRLQAERDRQQMQLDMERAVLENAKREKDRLVRDFYRDVIGQINTLINEVCSTALESIEENGQLKGRVSMQLRGLIRQLEGLNFMKDRQVEDQIKKLREVLPEKDPEAPAPTVARLDTTRIRDVVRTVNKQAEAALIELGEQPHRRMRRIGQVPQSVPDFSSQRRTRRTGRTVGGLIDGFDASEDASEEEDANNMKKLPRKRRRKLTS